MLFDEFIIEQEDQVDNEISEKFVPLKKYHLLQRLVSLQNKLNEKNLVNNDLDTILIFGNELNYDSIVHLVRGILPFLQQQIKEDTINEKKTNSV